MNISTEQPLSTPGAQCARLPARPLRTPWTRRLAARGVDLGAETETTVLWAIYQGHLTNRVIFSDMCIYNIL